ncbi:MAG: cytidine deaminase [Deltaproteobacteria bacterium]|jgi:cytidine deaminase|nr:cytidine deaminase [Deltaproteobacteria bacterium]
MNKKICSQLGELFQNSQQILPKPDEPFDGVLSSEIVNNILSLQNIPITQLQIILLSVAASYHISPISNYAVGAIVLGQSGKIYFGSNIEFVHTGLQFTIHAEQCAIINATQHMEKGIKSITVNAPPCGFCRQFINEIKGAEDIEFIVAGNKPKKFKSYLPDAFSGKDLSVDVDILNSSLLNYQFVDQNVDDNELFGAALAAANRSYSPYSRSVSGVAFRMSNDKIIAGSYHESAAFNPTVTAIQSAIIRARLDGFLLKDIRDVVFLQNSNNCCDYSRITTEILNSITPDAMLTIGLIY